MTDTSTALELLQKAPPGGVADLSALGTVDGLDYRPAPNQTHVTVTGLRSSGTYRLRGALGWVIDRAVLSGPAAEISLLGGDGCSIISSTVADSASYAQLQIANDDFFGVISAPTNFSVLGSTFTNQAISGPPAGIDPNQCHNAYVHTTVDVPLNGLFRDCTFSGAPYGSNLKLGGTNNWSGFARGVDVTRCTFRQSNHQGVNLLLVGARTLARVTDCDAGGANDPGEGVTARGAVAATFTRSPFTAAGQPALETASMAEKWQTWTFLWWSGRYKVPWYVPHSELTAAACGQNLEGLVWQ